MISATFTFLTLLSVTTITTVLGQFPELANDQVNQQVSEYLTKFFRHHQIPCFVAGYQMYKKSLDAKKINGQSRWLFENSGWSDIENRVECKFNTMMRVASVSKAIGSALVASLVEAGKLQWDDDVHKHLSESIFPQKTWNSIFDL